MAGLFWALVGALADDAGAGSAIMKSAAYFSQSTIFQVAVGVWVALLVVGLVFLISRYRVESRLEHDPVGFSVSVHRRHPVGR